MAPTTGTSISPTVITQPHIVPRLMSTPTSRSRIALYGSAADAGFGDLSQPLVSMAAKSLLPARRGMIKVLIGDIFESKAQTLVNTVNTVGVMGKGIALGFRKRFPEMFEDYVRRCERHEVQLTRPYIYRRLTP